MSKLKEVTVQITFRPPKRRETPEASGLHTRILESVPGAKAEKMVRDLASYREEVGSRYKTYSYESDGADEEVLVALDLGEVVALKIKAQPIRRMRHLLRGRILPTSAAETGK